MTTGLQTYDIVALRFGVAGLVLLPVAARRGLAIASVGPDWPIIAGLAPYVLMAASGLRFAPAAD